jgi:carbon-monoxide dehydrogenase medium subunit
VGVAAVIRRADHTIAEVRLAFTGVGPGPVRAPEAEMMLRDRGASAKIFAEAARAASARLEPDSDIHATADYRREVAAVLVRRALELAWQRSGGRMR